MGYVVREMDLKEDRSVILDFWHTNHPRSLEWKFDRIYTQNPDGPARVCMAIHVESGNYVGMTAFFPRTIYVNGALIEAVVAGDFIVAPEHRVAGAAVLLQRYGVSDSALVGIDLVYGIPNKKAAVVLKRIGYRKIGVFSTMVKHLKSREYLENKGIPAILLPICSTLVDLALKFRALKILRLDQNFKSVSLLHFDDRFTALFEELKQRFKFAGNRSFSRLEWKFAEHLKGNLSIFAVFDKTESVALGYIAAISCNGVLDVVDFVLPCKKSACDSLFTFFICSVQNRKEKSIEVHFFENDQIANTFKNWGFTTRKGTRNLHMFYADTLNDRLFHKGIAKDWLLTKYDEDT